MGFLWGQHDAWVLLETVRRLEEDLQHKLETEGEVLSFTSLCHLLWATTEVGLLLLQFIDSPWVFFF